MIEEEQLFALLNRLARWVMILALSIMVSAGMLLGFSLGWFPVENRESPEVHDVEGDGGRSLGSVWRAPSITAIPPGSEGALIRYGRELIMHTSVYLGPKGNVRQISNGMNCQNCHLNAGTTPYGNNYGAVASKYPAFRKRSGTVEGFEKRINDCIERSLNGKKLDPKSKEMYAMVAYMKWLGSEVRPGEVPNGVGLLELHLPQTAADPVKGKAVYLAYCARCHGENGEGILAESGREYTYPPVYGENSYNQGAGLYRISRFAAFVKANMPYGVTYDSPFLIDEEAWNVAAYVNTMPRPEVDLSSDWPDLSNKPFDHPFSPYTDGFSEKQHKYGPFGPILQETR